MNRIETKKFKGILPVVGIILFLGSIALTSANGDRQLVGYLLTASYTSLLLGVVYARKLGWALFFIFLLVMIPMFDMWTGGKIDALGMLIVKKNETFLTMWGNFGRGILCLSTPIILAGYKFWQLKIK